MVKLNILVAAQHQIKDCTDSDITSLLVVWGLWLYIKGFNILFPTLHPIKLKLNLSSEEVEFLKKKVHILTFHHEST